MDSSMLDNILHQQSLISGYGLSREADSTKSVSYECAKLNMLF